MRFAPKAASAATTALQADGMAVSARFSASAQKLGLAALPDYQPLAQSRDFPLTLRQGRSLTQFHAFYDQGRALPKDLRDEILNALAQVTQVVFRVWDVAPFVVPLVTCRPYGNIGQSNQAATLAWLAGVIRDADGTYTVAFMAAGWLAMAAGPITCRSSSRGGLR